MSENIRKSQVEKRREHNRDLIRRMRNGESLKTVDSRASWYPPRPIIQKDQDAIKRLYQTQIGFSSREKERPSEALPVVTSGVRPRGRGLDEAS